jgi:hypothetical protein
MLSQMRNDALRKEPDAYPKTLASAYRIASGWSNEEAGGGSHSMDNHSAFLADTKGKKSGEIVCFICGVIGHYARDCEKRKGVEKALVATAAHDDGKEKNCDEWDVALVANSECILFTEHEILLDNETSINIFRDKKLLTGVRDAGRKVLVVGVHRGANGVKVTEEGDFSDIGTVYCSDSASANILSFASQIDAGADISYDKIADRFVMTPAGGRNTYLFGRKEASGSEGRFYTCDVRTMIVPKEEVFVQTVEDNMMSFTKRDVMQARKARETLARMGFSSVDHQQAIRTTNSGSNFDVTARDFETADAIWGKDIPSMKGNTKKQTTPAADVSVSPAAVQQEQVLSVDVMFIQKIAVLVGVSTPLDLTLATCLSSYDTLRPSRAAEVVKKGLLYFLGVLTSQNFKTRLIMTDGEGAVGKLRTELNSLGLEVDVSRAGSHVARVERRIQVLKERVRTHYYYLPFVPSLLVLLFLVLFCASRLNYEPSSAREWMNSPRELFLGRKADAKRDFRCAFGDYVQSTVPETDNSMKARTEDCVVMLPTGNRS